MKSIPPAEAIAIFGDILKNEVSKFLDMSYKINFNNTTEKKSL